MAMVQTEAERLTAIDTATAVGRRADGVVVATLHWEAERSLHPEDARRVRESIEWLGGLVSVIEDPLDLPNSLIHLETLEVLKRFGEMGHDGLSALTSPASSPLASVRPSASEERKAVTNRLAYLRTLLAALLEGQSQMNDLRVIRQAFEALAQVMLASVQTMLTVRSSQAWTETSAF